MPLRTPRRCLPWPTGRRGARSATRSTSGRRNWRSAARCRCCP